MVINLEHYAPHDDWAESVLDMAKAAGSIIGIDIDDIRFTGFWSQGDGASFTGSYEYKRGSVAAIRAEFPKAEKLHEIAETLAGVQRRNFYQLYASVTQSGRYYHEMTMGVDVENKRNDYQHISDDTESAVTEAMRDFARWIYAALEREYEYQSAWQIASAWQEREDEAKTEKNAARALIGEWANAGPMPDVARESIKLRVRATLESMTALLAERKELADAFHYWDDGKSVDIVEFAKDNL